MASESKLFKADLFSALGPSASETASDMPKMKKSKTTINKNMLATEKSSGELDNVTQGPAYQGQNTMIALYKMPTDAMNKIKVELRKTTRTKFRDMMISEKLRHLQL